MALFPSDVFSHTMAKDQFVHYSKHESMLDDQSRLDTYQDAFAKNSSHFKNSTILDVGAGTGILSLLASRFNPERIFAVEKNVMANVCKNIVKINNLEDVITTIHSRVEEILIDQVDIIITCWMGDVLFVESFVDSFIFSRKNFLKPDGLIFPSGASLYIAGGEDCDFWYKKFCFWNSCYEFDFKSVKNVAFSEPVNSFFPFDQIMTQSCMLKEFDLYKIELEDTRFECKFEIKCLKKDYIHCFVVWFNATFPNCDVTLCTSPECYPTHWNQTLFYLQNPFKVHENDVIHGVFKMADKFLIQWEVNDKIDFQYYTVLDSNQSKK